MKAANKTRTLPYAMKIVFMAAPVNMIMYILLTVLSACFDAAAAKALAMSVDSALLLAHGNMRFFICIIAYGLFLYILPEITNSLETILLSKIEYKISMKVSLDTIKKIIRLPISYIEEKENQNLIEQAMSVNGGFLLNYVFQYVYMLYFLIKFISVAVILLQYNVYLSIVIMVNLIITIIVNRYLNNKRTAFNLDMTEAERREEYYRSLLFNKDVIKDMKILGVLPFFYDLYKDKARENFAKSTRFNFRITKIEFAVLMIKNIISFAAYGFGFSLIMHGMLTAGGFIAFYTSSGNLIQYFDLFMSKISRTHTQSAYTEKYITLMNSKEESADGKISEQGFDLVMRNVSFRYKSDSKDVLSDIDLTIHSSEKLAIVGENGAGKSTLVRLISGLNKPTGGEITVGKYDISELDISSYRKRISIVPQDFCKYYLSVRENIGFGNVEKINDTESIMEAASSSDISKLISGFANGVQQLIGTQYKDGIELSGGEWQRLSLSRAYFGNGDILILDEPTASLDAYSEEFIYNRFIELSNNKTTAFVTHRMATARLADRIVVLENGRIIESGSHEELMNINGKYKSLFEEQANAYKL